MHFLLDKMNNGTGDNNKAANNNRGVEARSRQLKRKGDD
jgi:hypothetical protein